MARIRKENFEIPHQEVDTLFNFDKCYYCALSVNLTCILSHRLFRDIFSSFYANWTYVTGKTYWCSWSLFFSNQWLHNVWILVALCNCDFRNSFPGISLKHSFYGLPLRSLSRKIIYTGCPRRKGPNFGRVFLRSIYNDITLTPIFKVQCLRRYWPETFETLTTITHLLIIKYILKLAGICGFCNVNICT